jgi:hypothetical protein
MKHVILIQVFTSLYVYIDVLNYGSGFIIHTFGVYVVYTYTRKFQLRVY